MPVCACACGAWLPKIGQPRQQSPLSDWCPETERFYGHPGTPGLGLNCAKLYFSPASSSADPTTTATSLHSLTTPNYHSSPPPPLETNTTMAEPEADNLRIMQNNPQDADLSDETQDFRFLNMFKKYPHTLPSLLAIFPPPMLIPQNRLRLPPSPRRKGLRTGRHQPPRHNPR